MIQTSFILGQSLNESEMSLGAKVYQFLLGIGLYEWGVIFGLRKGDEILTLSYIGFCP